MSVINTRKKILVGGSVSALLLLIVLLYTSLSSDGEQQVSHMLQKNEVVLTHATSVPVRVSGVLEPQDTMMVYAQVNGDITYLPKEGDVLSAGEQVALIDTPVITAKYDLARKQQLLTGTQQKLVLENTQINYSNKSVIAESAERVASIRDMGNKEDFQDAKETLITNIERSILQLVATLDYIDTNRAQFTANGLSQYKILITDVYNHTPNFLSNGLLSGSGNTELRLQERFKSITNQAAPDVDALLSLADDTRVALAQVSDVLRTGENKMFDERNTSVGGSAYTAYMNMRDAVLAAKQNLETYSARMQNIADVIKEDAAMQEKNTQVATHTASLAEQTLALQNDIAKETQQVTEASAQVLASEIHLANIHAPFDGVVTNVFVEPGEYVSPGTALFEIHGTQVHEAKVSVPAQFADYVKVGQPFIVNGKVVGYVERYAPLLQHGSLQVFIVVGGEGYLNGTVLTGELMLSSEQSNVYTVPRSYVHYDTTGPLVKFSENNSTPVSIVYDTGAELYVIPEHIQKQALLPSVGGAL